MIEVNLLEMHFILLVFLKGIIRSNNLRCEEKLAYI